MDSSADSDMEIIDNFEAIRLLINTYLVKKVKSLNKPIRQDKFVENVRKEFKNRGYTYSKKAILYTWKYLLDKYQFYKESYTNEEAKKIWMYFPLMNNCFDDFKQSSEKFKDQKWTFLLIESLTKHKSVVLRFGLTMDILQSIEDEFLKVGNDDINQKDIYNQWVFLKRFYRQNQKTGYYKQVSKNQAYFTALRAVFESDVVLERPISISPDVTENELIPAVEPIEKDEVRYAKKRKITCETEQSEEISTEIVSESGTVPFTSVMHIILLQCLKKNSLKIQNLKGRIDEGIVQEAFEDFQELGYNVTQESIANEWNDLSCRYELIKNTEHPQKWPFYNDMNNIYNSKDAAVPTENQDSQNSIGNIIIKNLVKDQNLKSDEYTKLTERLLTVYESNSNEFAEIKDILIERNLLREETNYLLNALVEKLNKKSEKENP